MIVKTMDDTMSTIHVVKLHYYTINKPCGEPGGTSGRIDRSLCKTHYLNLLPQSCQNFNCIIGWHSQTERLSPNHYTAVATNRRLGCWSQTKHIFLLQTDSRVCSPRLKAYPPNHYPAVAPSRRQGWECPRPNAYPPTTTQGLGCWYPNPTQIKINNFHSYNS